MPAHFALRKSELRRERMEITKNADGSVEAVNGLGADLSQFWYLDERGNLFRADATAARLLRGLENKVSSGALTPSAAARHALAAFAGT